MSPPDPIDARRHERRRELYGLAVDLAALERRPFLETACSDDPALKQEVLRLLDHDNAASASASSTSVERA